MAPPPGHIVGEMRVSTPGLPETIIELAGEGGGLRLLGRRVSGGSWAFQLLSLDGWPALLDEESAASIFRESHWVKSWLEAVRLLDRYRWVRLIPTQVHWEFREDVFVEATRRLLEDDPNGARRSLQRWAGVCRVTESQSVGLSGSGI
jgi:hypothetical protein